MMTCLARFIFLLLPALAGCGDEFMEAFSASGDPFPMIRHPRAGEITSGEDELAYLVAFKAHADSAFDGDVVSYLSHAENSTQALYDNFVTPGLARDGEFVAQVDMLARGYERTGQLWEDIPGALAEAPMPEQSQMLISRMTFESLRAAHNVLSELAMMGKIWFAEPDFVSVGQSISSYQVGSSTLSNDPANPESPPDHPAAVESFSAYAEKYTEFAEKEISYNHNIAHTKVHKVMEHFAGLDETEQKRMVSSRPVIAILDSGTQITHQALDHNIVDLSGKLSSKSCGGSRNGCNVTRKKGEESIKTGMLGHKDFYPYGSTAEGGMCTPTVTNDEGKKVSTSCDHGTAVAGFAVGYDPGEDIFGACPFCLYLPVRITADQGGISDSAILRGLQYVSLFRNNGEPLVRIINMSLGRYGRSRSVEMMIRNLKNTGTKGIITIAAAGNEATFHRSYPASFSDVISVSALNKDKDISGFSNGGHSVDIAAPGEGLRCILTTDTDTYRVSKENDCSGTSYSAPIVSGIAGLLLARKPKLTAYEVEHILTHTVDTRIYINKNRDYVTKVSGGNTLYLAGEGLVDAEKAVIQAKRYLNGKRRFIYRVGGCVIMGPHESRSAGHHHPSDEVTGWLWLLILAGVGWVVRGRRQDQAQILPPRK